MASWGSALVTENLMDQAAGAGDSGDDLRALLDDVGAILWAADPEMHHLTHVSSGMAAFGYPLDHWLTVADFFAGRLPPDAREGVLSLMCCFRFLPKSFFYVVF